MCTSICRFDAEELSVEERETYKGMPPATPMPFDHPTLYGPRNMAYMPHITPPYMAHGAETRAEYTGPCLFWLEARELKTCARTLADIGPTPP